MLQKGASRREPPSDGRAHGIHGNRAGTPSLHLYPSRHQTPSTLPPNHQCERSFVFKTQTASLKRGGNTTWTVETQHAGGLIAAGQTNRLRNSSKPLVLYMRLTHLRCNQQDVGGCSPC